MNREDILRLLSTHRGELSRFGVASLAVFGSSARNEARPDSDVDILVEFNRPTGLFAFVRLKLYLENLLERPVDLVTPDAIRRGMRDQILAEAIRAI